LEELVAALFPIKTFLVFITTALTVAVSLMTAFYLRFEFQFPVKEIVSLERAVPVFIIVKLSIFFLFRIYSGMWRYVSIYDLIQIFLANLVSSIVIFLLVVFWQTTYFAGFSRSVIVLDFLICFFAVSGKRILARIIREASSKERSGETIKTLIVASSSSANSLIHAFSSNMGRREFCGIISDQIKENLRIRGVPTLGKVEAAAKIAKKLSINEILLMPPYSTPAFIKNIMEQLEQEDVKCALRMLPAYADIASGAINVSNIKNVEIEDLLGRRPVKLDNTEVAKFAKGKTVMVTGAGGSIGSELCRQIASYNPARLVLFELSEFNIYETSRKLREDFPSLPIESIIGDIRCERDLDAAMAGKNIDIVYHAAAYKHVPLMEENPLMAFETNVLGSAKVFDASERHKAKRVIIISTDKAICPTSIMGASKRLSELIVMERHRGTTEFVVVRFGNVLDSSGSVIPLFKEQIRKGGPVTVTSKNVMRYFMSIPEAVDLVLQAGAIGHDREIMVLDMGEPVKIHDMAKKLIELSGFIPGRDIEIKIVGMRPGEKEYEELLADEEKVHRTPYDRIFVARTSESGAAPVDIAKITNLTANSDIGALRKLLKKHIPENKFSDGDKN
jgi:FlaA1/EpsC-like NDP-sugar epimerase